MLTERLTSGVTGRSTGSPRMGAPGGTTTQVLPPQVSGLRLAWSTAPSLPASAMLPAPIVSGLVPYAFERTTRTLWPLTLMRATWRIVWFSSTSGTPNGAGSSSAQRGAGVEAQVVIHALVAVDAVSAP